ncbi:MAG: hypothetical protein LBU46_01870 [Candidatus Accumulibacter sp.]|nr:hypothetical protein [Accumulibacter sp.]
MTDAFFDALTQAIAPMEAGNIPLDKLWRCNGALLALIAETRPPRGDWAINRLLRHFGVQQENYCDEFEAAGLGKFRSNEAFLREPAEKPERRKTGRFTHQKRIPE